MDIDIRILDCFPSVEKLIKNDKMILEINKVKYNFKNIIDNNELIRLSKISNEILFKIYNNKKELFGSMTFEIEKLKELFTLDGKSYIFWLEFKREKDNNKIDIFYNIIRIKMKITPINNSNLTFIDNDNKNKVVTNYNNRNNLINKDLNLKIEPNNICYLSSSNFYKRKYDEEYISNFTDKNSSKIKKRDRTKKNKVDDIKYKFNSIPSLNRIFSSNNRSNISSKPKKKKIIKKNISNKTSNNIKKSDYNYLLTENNNSKFSKKIDNELDKNNMTYKICNKTPSKVNEKKIKEKKKIKKSNSINNNIIKISDDDINTTNNTNQNNFHNKFENLSKSYNNKLNNYKKSKEKIINKKHNINIKENNLNIDRNKNIEKASKLFNLSKPLKLLDNNYIKANYTNRYDQGQINDYYRKDNAIDESCIKNKKNVNNSANLNEFISLEDLDKIENNINSDENSHLININNISITNNSLNDVTISNNNVINAEEDKDSYFLNSIHYNEKESFKEFNSLKKNFDLFYSKLFIKNIKKDLIDLEFNLALEKILALFECYNNELEILYYKNINLRNILKNIESEIKILNKKSNKLDEKSEDLKLKQNRALLVRESEFHFNEDLKMQKLIQKQILENIFKNSTNKRQRLLQIFKEIIRSRPELLEFKNSEKKINHNNENNMYSHPTQKTFNNVYQIYKNKKVFENKINLSNNIFNVKRTPKMNKNAKKYKMNSTDNRYSNYFSPIKSFSKGIFNKNLIKTNGSYYLNNGSKYIYSPKNKIK